MVVAAGRQHRRRREEMSVVNKSRMSSGNKIGFYYENLKLIKIAINRVHRHPIYSATVDDSR